MMDSVAYGRNGAGGPRTEDEIAAKRACDQRLALWRLILVNLIEHFR